MSKGNESAGIIAELLRYVGPLASILLSGLLAYNSLIERLDGFDARLDVLETKQQATESLIIDVRRQVETTLNELRDDLKDGAKSEAEITQRTTRIESLLRAISREP